MNNPVESRHSLSLVEPSRYDEPRKHPRSLTTRAKFRRRTLGLLALEDVAAALEVAPATVRNWVARREIPHFKRGKRVWFLRESLREWFREKETKPHGCN